MRLRPPRAGFNCAFSGDLGDMATFANWPTKRRRDLDAALNAETAAYGTAPVPAAAGWAPVTPDLLERIREGLSRNLDRNRPADHDLPQMANGERHRESE